MVGVAVHMMKALHAFLPELRYQPTRKRVRVRLDGDVVADTRRALLVWEPRRVVPAYAVPEADMTAALEPATAPSEAAEHAVELDELRGVLDPSTGFGAHSTSGRPLTVVHGSRRVEGAAFRPADPDLDGYVVLDFDAFEWWEEDEPIVGHPRDPLSRIDVLASSRQVRLDHAGVLLAESRRPRLLFESGFPMARYYLPRNDVRVEMLPSERTTTCAYKGHATHYTVVAGGEELPGIAWSYEDPLPDAVRVRGLICFYQERLDLTVDGELQPRPRTPWSPRRQVDRPG